MNLKFKTSRGIICLNARLVLQQGLTEEQVKEIKKLHKKKSKLYDKIEKTKDKELLKEIEQNQFDLQRAWGFTLDARYHDWFLIPGCKCGVLDNLDARGTPFRHINLDCPYHGEIKSQEKETKQEENT